MEQVDGRPDINNALLKLHSDKVDERASHLGELKSTIWDNRNNSRFKEVKDAGYHLVLEIVFRFVKLEVSNYARASKSAKTKVESRLSACAGVVRTVVEVGIQKLRHKTVKALLEHIIQTLPTADAGYCEPLLRDYFKALAALLEHTAHPEHFLGDEWHEITDFCIQTAQDLKRSSEVDDFALPNGSNNVYGSNSRGRYLSRSATPRSTGDLSQKPASKKFLSSPLKESDREITMCLQHLLSVPNAPVLDRAQIVLSTLVDLLQSYSSVGNIKQAAFNSINSIMSRVVTNDIHLALQTVRMIIPLFRRFWEPKESLLKETLLEFLCYGEVLLPRLISEDETGDHSADLQALVDILRDDYCIRRHREQLILDDLTFPDPTCSITEQVPLSIKSLQVRLGALKAEHPWCLISMSAAILVALEADSTVREIAIESDESHNPPKRQKLTHPLDDVFQFAKGSSLQERLYALQMLVFVFETAIFDAISLQNHLESLLPLVSDDDGLLASWTMLVMNSAAGQNAARTANLKDFWLRVWRIVARLITSSSTCRAACQLMGVILSSGLIQYADIADVVDGMIRSVDLNGPAECDGSATTLWTILVALRGQQHLSSASETSGDVLHWLFNRWSPAKVRDRHHTMYIAQHFSVFSTLRLICVCFGLSTPPPSLRSTLNLGLLSQARLKCLRDRKLMKYLLLAEESQSIDQREDFVSKLGSSNIKLANIRFQALAGIVLDFLLAEASSLLRGKFSSPKEPASSINTDAIRISTSFCIIGYSLLSNSNFQSARQKEQLQRVLDELRNGVIQCMLCHNERQELIKGVFDSFGLVLGSVEQLAQGKDLLANGAITMSQGFDKGFWREVLNYDSTDGADVDHDAIQLDSEFQSFDSEMSIRREADPTPENIHYEIAAATSLAAFRACIAAKVCFISGIRRHRDSEIANAPQAVPLIVDYLTSLKAQDFVVCRSFLWELLKSGVLIAEEDANTLLEYSAAFFLRRYEFERCEVSMGVCLDVMTGLAEIWTVEGNSDVVESGAQMYSWFITIALKAGIASPHVHICISTMLQNIIKVRPEYARSLSLPSARTCLFEVLREGSIVVKFHIGNSIGNIFGLFVLKEHENILEDVIGSLPEDPAGNEGIALRLFVLAHLAASWSTLLRRCVYAIIETPAHIPDSTGYAQNCLIQIATSLKLPKVQNLFKLFVSQIIYTWLATQPLRSIPYSVFGYSTLSELLSDVQDEVVGQVAMRGNDDAAAQLAEDLGLPFEKLLEVSFSKATAYCIARDTALRPTISTHAPEARNRLRKSLNKEQYTLLVNTNFARILALFYRSIDTEGQIEKGFEKYPGLTKAYATFREIMPKDAPVKILPPNQQPFFKARYLFDEIECLCKSTSYDAESLWSPALYIYVFREILNAIHPALGSMHACSVLRKIRILICTAGTTALEQYPIEMALHALRPFLTDGQCAEDAIGMVQYLLRYGNPYLKGVPSFLAGHAVSTLTSMRAFFDSTQDSTTQESEFKATMSRAQSFHTWYVRYLEAYTSPHLSEESATSFRNIVKAASSIQNGGNARVGTYESDLLLELLEDERSGRDLLDQSSKDVIFRFLCTTFEVPSDFRDDIFGSDEQAARYAPTVWNTCQRSIVGTNYLLWAGRVLGRAYAGKGLIDRDMVYETHFESESRMASAHATTSLSSSRTRILRLLFNILSGDHRTDVGMAETTLRFIVTRTDGTDGYLECELSLPPSLHQALLWRQYSLPANESHPLKELRLQESASSNENQSALKWIQRFCIALTHTAVDDPILSELPHVAQSIEDFAEKAFPYVLHLVLSREASGHQTTRKIVSQACQEWFQKCANDEPDENTVYSVRILIRAILYLRTQHLPHETVEADRSQWLELDYKQAAAVAVKCSMFKTALLFLEIDFSEVAKASRRSLAIKSPEPTDLLLEIYQHIDEQDAFYGVQQPSSLSSMMVRLEYEHAGFKSLSFRGAHYDGQIRQSTGESQVDEESMVRALDNLDLNGLSQSLLNKMTNTGPGSIDSVLRTARKLEQWDISAPASYVSSASTVYRAFQGINNATDSANLLTAVNTGFNDSMHQLRDDEGAKSSIHAILGSLAILTEADEVFSCKRSEQLYEVLKRFEDRHRWMYSESFEHINGIISCRETTFSSLSKKPKLQDLLKTSQRDARSVESRNILASSKMSRLHGALQNALTTATYLTQLVGPCEEAGIDITAAVRFESANVLWGQGEMTASIRMLQDLQSTLNPQAQLIHVGKPELLAKLGHQISEARLEKPDEIIDHYLSPAIKELHGSSEGDEAGEVFHEFASFCDQQLQNADSLEDFHRIQRLRERKEGEVQELERMIKKASSQARERDNLRTHRNRAKQWFDLDDREFQRLRESRQTFLRQSLENYLLCLKACDKYDKDALRFSALWLENYNSEIANGAVSKHIGQVGSRKFAPLMNQWSSRLLDDTGQFQTLLSSLVLRICVDHPYHGMYQIFAGSKTRGGKDETALSRNAAANNIVHQLKASKRASLTWLNVHNTNITFVKFASERLEDSSIKPGSKVPLRKSATGLRVEQDVLKQKVPPPTMKTELRADCDYSNVPMIARFQPEFSIASGISMPKIITAIGTDGLKYKQLFKGGNDDLRQDSIMEQVFEQVSSLLQTQRATRQRNLGIRTYKVLPLTATAGIIEFVPNTTPLHEYLLPAHQRHFPKDLKPNNCRKHIADAQSKSVDQRIKTYRQVCDHFHPVLRYFFMERFENPDDWFEKRLAYTRSTAAISILGHVLGLGDRHGHNILLDEKTGEVVHIDLGIAFEQGRVLPVPEVVPFRLTRDLVDGMGITRTEGVFRRCCEFTLEALRNESYSIMTILDVLRYDPLYSWSLSPLRMKKAQEEQAEASAMPVGDGKREDEPGEADRALTVVKKKLSRTLSVQATVNELIQMATDERNLAVLFCGWAAYA